MRLLIFRYLLLDTICIVGNNYTSIRYCNADKSIMKDSPNILAIHTAHDFCSTAIKTSGVLRFTTNHVPNTQAESLFMQIDDILASAAMKYDDITHVATISNPGSFTGIRVGLAAAKSICICMPHVQHVSVEATYPLAFRAQKQFDTSFYDSILVILRPYKNASYYFKLYDIDLCPLSDLINGNVQEIRDAQANARKSNPIICGNGAKDLLQDFAEHIILPRCGLSCARSLVNSLYNISVYI